MSPNEQQSEAWNGAESVQFVEHADQYDRQFAPIADALLERARPAAHHTVLDVGCGCGATTLAVAGMAGSALGADLSEPLLAVATRRAGAASVANVDFVIADAQTYAFPASTYDLVISQLGLMFFDDTEFAFANLRRAIVPGGQMAFTCWQGLESNEWVSVVGQAVAQHGSLPALGGQARGPGMFALKQPDEISALLEGAGFAQVEIESFSPTILVGGGGTLDESLDFLVGAGIARGLLGQLTAEARTAALASVRASLAERYEPGLGVRVGASVWIVTASN